MKSTIPQNWNIGLWNTWLRELSSSFEYEKQEQQPFNSTMIKSIIIKSATVLFELSMKRKICKGYSPSLQMWNRASTVFICLLKRCCIGVKTRKPQLSLKCLYQPTFTRFTEATMPCWVIQVVPVVRLYIYLFQGVVRKSLHSRVIKPLLRIT